MPEHIALLAGYTRHNTGDWLLVKHGLEFIRERHPGSLVTVVAADPDSFKEMGPGVQVLGGPVRADHLRGGLGEYALHQLSGGRRAVPALSAIAQADVAYTCGGGYLQARSVRELATISAVHVSQMLQAHRAGVPLRMLPQSIGPFTGPASERWGKAVLGWFPEALAREAISAEYVSRLMPQMTVRQVPDLVFWSEREPQRRRAEPSQSRVGMVVRNWWFPGSADPEAAERTYLMAFAKLAEDLEAAGHVPELVIHADGPTQRGDDRVASERVRRYANVPVAVREVTETHDLRAVEAIYRGYDVVVSTRMHGALMAIGQGVPTVCVGYEWKARGIFESLSLGDFVTPIDAPDLRLAKDLADDPHLWPETVVTKSWAEQRAFLRQALLGSRENE